MWALMLLLVVGEVGTQQPVEVARYVSQRGCAVAAAALRRQPAPPETTVRIIWCRHVEDQS